MGSEEFKDVLRWAALILGFAWLFMATGRYLEDSRELGEMGLRLKYKCDNKPEVSE